MSKISDAFPSLLEEPIKKLDTLYNMPEQIGSHPELGFASVAVAR
jgi:hypothetical protein